MAGDDQNNNNDEYQFADLDALGMEDDTVSLPEDEPVEGSEAGMSSPPGRGRFDNLDPQVIRVLRNGAIAVGAFILVFFIYKTVGSLFSPKSSKKDAVPVASKTQAVQKATQTPLPIRTATPTSPMVNTSVAATEDVVKLKQEQQRIEAELSTMRAQMSTIAQNMSDMSAKMADVKQTMLVLSERLEQQSQQMGRLQTMSRAKRVASSRPSSTAKKYVAPKPTYSIQAIIPGRAWLMSSQGKTLTVSRGSVVPGYGVVRLINAKVGRVFTSSGRVIQFSQSDT
ncbi:MAG: type IVB secretion system protein IcmG/DotF [Legionellaceae bacterium]|nr:type IVB secretion system protein IcmG/DotF [Legionellaceae bacterium]